MNIYEQKSSASPLAADPMTWAPFQIDLHPPLCRTRSSVCRTPITLNNSLLHHLILNSRSTVNDKGLSLGSCLPSAVFAAEWSQWDSGVGSVNQPRRVLLVRAVHLLLSCTVNLVLAGTAAVRPMVTTSGWNKIIG